MNLQRAEQAIVNAIYAAVAWLILDLGLLFQKHTTQSFSVLLARPEMLVGILITVVCIYGLYRKNRIAAIVLFLLFLLPLVLRLATGTLPSAMMLIFSLILLYFFFVGVLATFRYHYLQAVEQGKVKKL